MNVLPGGTATFLLLFGLFLGAFAVRSTFRLSRVLHLVRHGVRVEGRCVERRVVDRGADRERGYATEYVFAFRTLDGREVEFVDHAPGPFGLEVGTPVRVTYDPAAPDKHATIAAPRAWGPVLMPAVFAAGLTVFSLGLLYGFVAMRGWV